MNRRPKKGKPDLANLKDLGISWLSDPFALCKIPGFISTGSLVLDEILGGGIPKGRLVEIYGKEGSGKSSLAHSIAGQAQKLGSPVLLMDSEAAVDADYACLFGLDVSQVLYASPETMEEAFTTMEGFLKRRSGDDNKPLVVWDSVAATSTLSEQKKKYGERQIADHARLVSQGMRKLVHVMSQTKATLVFVNQVRIDIGIQWGNPMVTFAGSAIKFYASQRLEVRRIKRLCPKYRPQKAVGILVGIKVIKNKIASPFLECSLPLFFAKGFSDNLAIFLYLRDQDYLKRAGGRYRLSTIDKTVTRAEWMKLMETDKSFKKMVIKTLQQAVSELREWKSQDLEIEM